MVAWADPLRAAIVSDNDVADYMDDGSIIWCGVSGGSANVQTLSPALPLVTYRTGQKFMFIAGFTPTASLTINITGLGPKTVKMSNGSTNLSGSEFIAGEVVVLLYDGTNLRLVPPQGATLTSWTPTYSASGSMTYTSVTTQFGKYLKIGKGVYFQLWAAGTTGGTASNALIATLPFTAVGLASSGNGGGCWVYDGGANNVAGLWTMATTGLSISVSKYDGSNFALAANKQFSVNGWYEAA